MNTDTKKRNDFLTQGAAFGFALLLWSFLLTSKTFAQSAEEGASLGVKIGLNTTTYNVTDASLKNEPGFNIGIFSNAYLAKNFSLQPEINLNVLNSSISVSNEITTARFKVVLSYVEFVLSGRVNLGKTYLLAGPYISYLANASITNNSAVNEMDRKSFYDIDYGFVYSAGIQLKRWDLGLRYNDGLYKIGKPSVSGNPNVFENSKISSFQLYGGYYF